MASFGESLASPEVEIAEGGAIIDTKARFADLKTMLDSSKDNLKMDAMKRIINLVAKGRDVSDLFPAVVKNVAAKNFELKKLVFVYLVRYAEEQQDLALLSISTFQRALKDPNQYIRASALRVLSSIRVPMIAPIMLLAIREAVRDMSAYVRKVAAHAIPKLYSLEENLQAELIECIDFLLGDNRTLVLGSAVYAFEETCPDRLDLLHRHYRALCRAIADVDEWGQVLMIGLLTRYARSQLQAPGPGILTDPDLVLLLASARPLLQSRNCAVVLAVAQLFHNCAPHSQLAITSRALVRLLRGPREVQSVVLVNIATICASDPNLFEPFLKSFFIRPAEPKHIKLLKLQVLTSLVSETNVQLVLRELQTYVGMTEMIDAAMDAIGECAVRVNTVAQSCLSGLVSLIASSNENVVSAAVVVLKRLLHSNPPLPLLKRVLRLIDSVKAPQARACVVWLCTNHVDKVATLAPDVLRMMAKSFPHDTDVVKLQTLNLAAKLWLTNRAECEQLAQYVLQLARFDQSYDIRDRCRFLRNLLIDNNNNKLAPFAAEIFNSEKPPPTTLSTFKDREQFQLSTLSHYLNQRCARYRDLPPFPEVPPDSSVRNTKESEEKLGVNGNYTDEIGEANDEDDVYSDEEDEDESDESDEDESESDEDEESDGEDDEEDGDEEDTDNGDDQRSSTARTEIESKAKSTAAEKSSTLDLLLDLNFDPVPAVHTDIVTTDSYTNQIFKPLLSHAAWSVGVSVELCFPREQSSLSTMRSVLLKFTNRLNTISDILTVTPKEYDGISTSGAFEVNALAPSESIVKRVGIDFGDSKRASEWTIGSSDGVALMLLQIEAPMGEQLEPLILSEQQFEHEMLRLSGMHEHIAKLENPFSSQQLLQLANCVRVVGSETHFSARTISKKQSILITLESNRVRVNSENIVIGSLLCDDIVKKSIVQCG